MDVDREKIEKMHAKINDLTWNLQDRVNILEDNAGIKKNESKVSPLKRSPRHEEGESPTRTNPPFGADQAEQEHFDRDTKNRRYQHVGGFSPETNSPEKNAEFAKQVTARINEKVFEVERRFTTKLQERLSSINALNERMDNLDRRLYQLEQESRLTDFKKVKTKLQQLIRDMTNIQREVDELNRKAASNLSSARNEDMHSPYGPISGSHQREQVPLRTGKPHTSISPMQQAMVPAAHTSESKGHDQMDLSSAILMYGQLQTMQQTINTLKEKVMQQEFNSRQADDKSEYLKRTVENHDRMLNGIRNQVQHDIASLSASRNQHDNDIAKLKSEVYLNSNPIPDHRGQTARSTSDDFDSLKNKIDSCKEAMEQTLPNKISHTKTELEDQMRSLKDKQKSFEQELSSLGKDQTYSMEQEGQIHLLKEKQQTLEQELSSLKKEQAYSMQSPQRTPDRSYGPHTPLQGSNQFANSPSSVFTAHTWQLDPQAELCFTWFQYLLKYDDKSKEKTPADVLSPRRRQILRCLRDDDGVARVICALAQCVDVIGSSTVRLTQLHESESKQSNTPNLESANMEQEKRIENFEEHTEERLKRFETEVKSMWSCLKDNTSNQSTNESTSCQAPKVLEARRITAHPRSTSANPHSPSTNISQAVFTSDNADVQTNSESGENFDVLRTGQSTISDNHGNDFQSQKNDLACKSLLDESAASAGLISDGSPPKPSSSRFTLQNAVPVAEEESNDQKSPMIDEEGDIIASPGNETSERKTQIDEHGDIISEPEERKDNETTKNDTVWPTDDEIETSLGSPGSNVGSPMPTHAPSDAENGMSTSAAVITDTGGNVVTQSDSTAETQLSISPHAEQPPQVSFASEALSQRQDGSYTLDEGIQTATSGTAVTSKDSVSPTDSNPQPESQNINTAEVGDSQGGKASPEATSSTEVQYKDTDHEETTSNSVHTKTADGTVEEEAGSPSQSQETTRSLNEPILTNDALSSGETNTQESGHQQLSESTVEYSNGREQHDDELGSGEKSSEDADNVHSTPVGENTELSDRRSNENSEVNADQNVSQPPEDAGNGTNGQIEEGGNTERPEGDCAAHTQKYQDRANISQADASSQEENKQSSHSDSGYTGGLSPKNSDENQADSHTHNMSSEGKVTDSQDGSNESQMDAQTNNVSSEAEVTGNQADESQVDTQTNNVSSEAEVTGNQADESQVDTRTSNAISEAEMTDNQADVSNESQMDVQTTNVSSEPGATCNQADVNSAGTINNDGDVERKETKDDEELKSSDWDVSDGPSTGRDTSKNNKSSFQLSEGSSWTSREESDQDYSPEHEDK